MNVSSVLFSACTCDLTCNIPKRTSKSSVFQQCLSAKQERCFRRYKPLRHAKRRCLPALAASTTGTSPAGRIKEEKEIAEALVQADLPYTTHSWQWKGHKVNYAVRIPPPIKFPPCSYQSLSYPNLFILCFCLSFLTLHAHGQLDVCMSSPMLPSETRSSNSQYKLAEMLWRRWQAVGRQWSWFTALGRPSATSGKISRRWQSTTR